MSIPPKGYLGEPGGVSPTVIALSGMALALCHTLILG